MEIFPPKNIPKQKIKLPRRGSNHSTGHTLAVQGPECTYYYCCRIMSIAVRFITCALFLTTALIGAHTVTIGPVPNTENNLLRITK